MSPLTSDAPKNNPAGEAYYESMYLSGSRRSVLSELVESQATEELIPFLRQPVGATPDLSHVFLEKGYVWTDGKNSLRVLATMAKNM